MSLLDDTLTRTGSFSAGLASFNLKKPTFFKGIDGLIRENEGDVYSDGINSEKVQRRYQGIRKFHWKDRNQYQSCSACNKTFNFASRKYNCRRCGEIFCENCCQFKKRLSPDAIPDPLGDLYRVCFLCADLQVQSIGQTRCLTSLMSELRCSRRINPLKEITRLLTGFKTHVKASKFHSSLAETISIVKIPDWQKSSKWLDASEVEWCARCNLKFSFLKAKRHCRVCGSIYCGQCIKNELMVYFDDVTHQPDWSLIGFVGCPDKEPAICTYLAVCLLCHEEIEELQVQHHYATDHNTAAVEDRLISIRDVLIQLNEVQIRIDSPLQRYQETADSATLDGVHWNEVGLNGKGVVVTMAKLQVDVSDALSRYFAVVQSLKDVSVSTKTESRLMRNILKDKCTFYNHQVVIFKGIKDTLKRALPDEAFDEIQEYADKQTVTNSYIICHQLGLEALHLITAFQLKSNDVARWVSEVDQACYGELKQHVINTGDDWLAHDAAVNQIIKERLSNKKLIYTREQARPDEIQSRLFDRCHSVLKKVNDEMEAKTSIVQFPQTKETLMKVIQRFNN